MRENAIGCSCEVLAMAGRQDANIELTGLGFSGVLVGVSGAFHGFPQTAGLGLGVGRGGGAEKRIMQSFACWPPAAKLQEGCQVQDPQKESGLQRR